MRCDILFAVNKNVYHTGDDIIRENSSGLYYLLMDKCFYTIKMILYAECVQNKKFLLGLTQTYDVKVSSGICLPFFTIEGAFLCLFEIYE